ncbi:MAG: hypothetical protein HKO62_00685 [Gammaproteobacteria bacterium]|nr:Hpt domain-containing protein [Gammaproteobacteria bacterium]NNL99232.1 hypothetical protein [Gammaproteobacteria bacterium]
MSRRDEEITRDFVDAAGAIVQRLAGQLADLIREPANETLLNQIFRSVHTIKGGAGFLNVPPLLALSHEIEDVLHGLREHAVTMDNALAETLLAGHAGLAAMIGELEADIQTELAPVSLTARSEDGAQETTEETGAAPPVPELDVGSEARVAGTAQLPGTVFHALLADIDAMTSASEHLRRVARHDDPVVALALEQLTGAGARLKATAERARRQPISRVFEHFERVACELSEALGKQVRLEFDGGQTELDTELAGAIAEPLLHLVRNAIDHGIELPEVRRAQGKAPCGCLKLSATREGDRVCLTIGDDGRGMYADLLRQRAVDRGVISAENAGTLSNKECLALILSPGFSTRDDVSPVSGRGVGMDIVNTSIERLGGHIDIDAEPNRGTRISLQLPADGVGAAPARPS